MQCPKCGVTPMLVQSHRAATDHGPVLIVYCRNCGYPVGVLRDDNKPGEPGR